VNYGGYVEARVKGKGKGWARGAREGGTFEGVG